MSAPDETNDVERLCNEASVHLEAGRFAQAYALLERAQRLEPDSALVHYRLALYHGDKGQVREALQALDRSLGIDPRNAKAHNNRGSMLEQLRRPAEAEVAFRRSLELDPTLAPPYINLGHLLEQRGAKEQAVAIYERAIAQGLDREMFEQYRAVAAGQVTRASPASWVRATFDNFAPAFDVRLRELGYKMPGEIARRLAGRAPGPLDILDLGCGTGQVGVALRAQVRSLVGVDVSPKMLQQAAAQGIYDETHVGEIHAFLRAAPSHAFDAVIAADVFVYIGALEEVFLETTRVLRPGGWFAFSTEEHGNDDYWLRPSGRYAQSEAYVRRLAAAAFGIHDAEPAVIRSESGTPIMGRMYLLQKNVPAVP
ncbi:MAG: tetratricopeptide repeat protein [Casimicrobiaceae bacterium]